MHVRTDMCVYHPCPSDNKLLQSMAYVAKQARIMVCNVNKAREQLPVSFETAKHRSGKVRCAIFTGDV